METTELLRLLLVLVLLSSCTDKTMIELNPNAAAVPVARKIPKQDTIHGDTRIDDYFWMREKANPDVTAYLNAENGYTQAVMKPTETLQETLYKEMVGRIKETDLSVPYRRSGYWYYSRTEQGKQYPIYCRKQGSLEATEEVLLDLNALAEGQKYLGLGEFEVSDDGRLLAYSTDITGFREYTLYVKNLETGALLPDRIEKTGSIIWASDNHTLFYTTEDHAKRHYRLFRHVLGGARDDLLFEEKDELYRIGASRSKDRAFMFLVSASATTSEVWYFRSDRPADSGRLIVPREEGHEYYVSHHRGRFYIRTNKTGRTFSVVSAPTADPRPENWKEFIAVRPDVMIEGIEFFANHAVIGEREDGLPRPRVIDLRNGQSHRVEFPEPVYTAFSQANHEFETNVFRFQYQSLVTPASVFDYDMDSRDRRLLKQTEVLGGYEAAQYASERIYAAASDGVRIPVSLVYKKGIRGDGSDPLLLYGYGSYGVPLSANFSSSRLSLLDRGVIYAIAHVRGGGDLGKPWHDQGRMLSKKNTFTDFIAAAEHLIAQKYTSPEHLAIMGGSAGGLLTGAVVNLRPDLFKVVVSLVPFVDVINTMLDASLPLTVGEYLEWGNPQKKDEYEYIKSYCPYTNIANLPYPTMLVRTSFNDSQVMYWEAAKYVAKLRATNTRPNVLLLKTNMAAGHGGSSGRYDLFRELAFDYAFILGGLAQ